MKHALPSMIQVWCILALFFLVSPEAFSQASAAPGGDVFTQSWVQRYDLRRKVDGSFAGLYYGRNQGSWTILASGRVDREDLYSVQSLKDNRGQETGLESRQGSRWNRGPGSALASTELNAGAGYPGASIPGGAPEGLQPGRFELVYLFDPVLHPQGSVWKENLLFSPVPDQEDAARWLSAQELQFTNQGLVDWQGRKVWDVRASCTLRTPSTLVRGKDKNGLSSLQSVSRIPGLAVLNGRRELRVLYDAQGLYPAFAQDRLDAQIVAFEGGSKVQQDGFVLTFFAPPVGDLYQRIKHDQEVLIAAIPDLVIEKKTIAIPPSPIPVSLPAETPLSSLVPDAPVVTNPPEEQIVSTLTAATDNITIRSTPGGIILEIPDLGFVADQAQLLPGELGRLKNLGKTLAGLEGVSFLVRGHTADWGSKESQDSLSLLRAQVISSFLVEAGVRPDRVLYEGCGSREPKADNSSPDGRAQNRRVEILVIRGPGSVVQ